LGEFPFSKWFYRALNPIVERIASMDYKYRRD
jgi:hypothetical protein